MHGQRVQAPQEAAQAPQEAAQAAHIVAQAAHAVAQGAHAVAQAAHSVTQAVQKVAQAAHAVAQAAHAVAQAVHVVDQAVHVVDQAAHAVVHAAHTVHALVLAVRHRAATQKRGTREPRVHPQTWKVNRGGLIHQYSTYLDTVATVQITIGYAHLSDMYGFLVLVVTCQIDLPEFAK